MTEKKFIQLINRQKALSTKGKKVLIRQVKQFFEIAGHQIRKAKYAKGDDVKLKKGTLLHGTYKNIEGLKEIVEKGLISSWFVDGRESKYPSSVGVWNLKQDCFLKDYIDYYSGGTILYEGIYEYSKVAKKNKTAVIPYSEMGNILEITSKIKCYKWTIEQTKEARFMPSLVQDNVQIGIIFNGNNNDAKSLLKSDILNPLNIGDRAVKPFINPYYYKQFIKDRKNKDDLFTDRESAILFGIPASLIEGIIVGEQYEKNSRIIEQIKTFLPDCYICNIFGKVIVGNKE